MCCIVTTQCLYACSLSWHAGSGVSRELGRPLCLCRQHLSDHPLDPEAKLSSMLMWSNHRRLLPDLSSIRGPSLIQPNIIRRMWFQQSRSRSVRGL
jgi:hypothetical protein